MKWSRLPATAGGTRAVVLDCEIFAGDEQPGAAAPGKEE
jgi:hypothetical protein